MYKSSTAVTTLGVDQLKKMFVEAKSITNIDEKEEKLIDITHGFFHLHEWTLAMDVIKSIPKESDRDFLIAELIEEYLIPNNQFDYARECVKFLTPEHEATILIQIRLALLEDKPQKALEFANELPTPVSRNYALFHIVQYYLLQNDVENAMKIGNFIVDNSRTIVNPLLQSQSLRNVAKNLFLAHGNVVVARKVAELIPDGTIKTQLLAIIDNVR
jgi:hypothetical protein